jgi:hypothetical protein
MKQQRLYVHLVITAPIVEWSLTRDTIALLGTIAQLEVHLLLRRNVQRVHILIVMKYLMPHNALSVLLG